MTTFQKTTFYFTFLLMPILMFPQQKTSKTLTLDTIPIKSQFDYIYNKSNNYNSYKVVNKKWFLKLQQNTVDTLKAANTYIGKNLTTINEQKTEIVSLKKQLEDAKNDYAVAKKEKDSMSLLGADMTKSDYSGTMWTIIFALLAGLAFFIYKFKNSNAVTKEAQKLLQETEQEFEEHRRSALEREQKVRRQLQDELNKNKVR